MGHLHCCAVALCVWRGGVAEQILSGLCATAQLEMGHNATVSLAVHACQRAQSVASPERRENARHLDLFHRVYIHRGERSVFASLLSHTGSARAAPTCNERVMAVGCTVVGPVAVGCAWARFTATLRSENFLSLFRPSGAATRPQRSGSARAVYVCSCRL